MADAVIEQTPAPAQLTLDQELDKFLSEQKKTTPAPEPEPTPEPAPAPTEEKPPEESDLQKKLEAIPTTPVEEPKATLTAEQQAILQTFTTPAQAQKAAEQVAGYENFTSTFARGDFDTVEQMLDAWNPNATQAFFEHLYHKRVMSGEWVDRFIADKEGNPTVHRGIQALESQIQDLKRQLESQHQERRTQDQRDQEARIAQSYMNHLGGLFKQIDFAEQDQPWVLAAIHQRVAADARVRGEINRGNPAAVNAIFKQAINEYVQRDKKTQADQAAMRQLQEQKKPLLQTAPVTPEHMPDDIHDVPKGKEDDWMTEKLNNLFASAKRKK